MKYEEIRQIIANLAKSQGFYGRVLAQFDYFPESELNKAKDLLEAENFTDPVDVVMFFEN